MADERNVLDPNIKIEVSSQEPPDDTFKRMLDNMERAMSTQKRMRLAQSAVKKAKNSGRDSRRKSKPMTAADRRNCEHRTQLLVWRARGRERHMWTETRDMNGPPTKTQAVQEMVYSFSNIAAQLVKPLTYSKWIQAWAHAVTHLVGMVNVNQTPRIFKDPQFPFVCTQIVPYGFFSVDASYFRDTIMGKDFKHGNGQSNPAFKARLGQLVANVVWKFICKSCPFYARSVIKTERNDKQSIPFCRMTLDCACGLCNLRLYVIIKSLTENADDRIEFEIFAEPRRLLSFVPQKYKADNSGRTFVAGDCGRCVVDTFVVKHDGAGTDLKAIYKHASVGIRSKVKQQGPNALPPLVDETLNGFNLLVAVMRNNHDVVGHKEETTRENLQDLLNALGLGMLNFDLYYNFRTLFDEMDMAKVPYLDRGVLVSLRKHNKEFVNENIRLLMFVSRQYFSILRTDTYPNIEWPQTEEGLTIQMKEEIFDDDSDDDMGCAEPAIESASITLNQSANGDDEIGRAMAEEPLQSNQVTFTSEQTSSIDFSELLKQSVPSQTVTNLVSPEHSPERRMPEEMVPGATVALDPVRQPSGSLALFRPESIQELMDTPLGQVFIPVLSLATKGKDDIISADEFYIAKPK